MFAQGGNGGGGGRVLPAASKFSSKQSIETIYLYVPLHHCTILSCHSIVGAQKRLLHLYLILHVPKASVSRTAMTDVHQEHNTSLGKRADSSLPSWWFLSVFCLRFLLKFFAWDFENCLNTCFSVFLGIKISWQVFVLVLSNFNGWTLPVPLLILGEILFMFQEV